MGYLDFFAIVKPSEVQDLHTLLRVYLLQYPNRVPTGEVFYYRFELGIFSILDTFKTFSYILYMLYLALAFVIWIG